MLDLGLSQAAAEAVGTATPLGALAEEIYAEFSKDGNDGVDFSGIINHLRGLSVSRVPVRAVGAGISLYRDSSPVVRSGNDI